MVKGLKLRTNHKNSAHSASSSSNRHMDETTKQKAGVCILRIIGFRKGKKRLIAAAAAAVICAAGIGIMNGSEAVAVQANSGRVPIYSVEPADTASKPIALTFNCAWDNSDVQSILNTLKEHEIAATFFLVGQWAEKYPDSVKAIADAGHEIGNHSYSHQDFAELDEKALVAEITGCSNAIESITGRLPELVRVPSGSYSDTALTVIEKMGMIPIQWDADSLDWKKVSAKKIVKNITSKAQPGSIALLHCGAKNTADALPDLIKALKKDGYTFTTVGKLIHRKSYTLDNAGRQHLTEDAIPEKSSIWSKITGNSDTLRSSEISSDQSSSEPPAQQTMAQGEDWIVVSENIN